MSYRDPRDPRDQDPRDQGTARYETGYSPQSRAYSQPTDRYQQQYGNQQPGDPRYNTGQSDPRYAAAGSYGNQPKQRRRPNINAGLYAGGVVMTGVVTGLAAWLVAWIIRAIAQRVNEAGNLGVWNPLAQDEYWFAITGFLCALAGGALWYVLYLTTPSPNQFYRWIVGLLIAAAAIIPLVLSAQISTGIGTAVVHLVIGLPVLSLIPAMGEKSIQR
ncbi:hypothetical protein A5788_21080 [Gordonia sp. 852002-50816_SCH5313054-c]|uniref:DUF6069 family protein n=1 Tax=unclassified Gordonia (in: high G+C Gram-positive bacteria) TaxID=2657482 RepID=UPI0007E926C7|nr:MULTISPECIES: DUF6069 family protein [unclassified Gordonia (in: high G+C Gram-positive bacteria)]OBC07649.1 hypothetical protein A5786_09230 [Gordonia sp. 852002-50816_SCH5313054-a]OBC12556.1 hypothetical protein A5788_21080 [Gordonia sp. 852002-50816_SCH5313054-c]